MADALDYLTLAEAKAALNIDTSNTNFDTELAGWITAVSRQLDNYVGPVVTRTITSESHDGGCASLFLKYRPVSSVTAVSEFSYTTEQALTGESNASKTATNYLLDAAKGILRRRSGGADTRFPMGRGNVIVTYVAGRYTSASVDEVFKTGARLTLSLLWRREQGFGTETFGAMGAFPGLPGFGLPNVVVDLLSDYALAPEV